MGKSSANIFAMSAIPQIDYQTLLAPSSVTKVHRQIEKDNVTFGKYSAPTSDNKGFSTGTTSPTRKVLESHDFSLNLSEDLSSQLLGERARAAFGSIETTELVAGQVWQHIFKLLDLHSADSLPAYDYVEKAAESVSRPNAHNVEFPSNVCGNFSISGEGTSVLKSSSSWKASGKRISPSPLTFFDPGSEVILLEDMVQNYFKSSAGKILLYPDKELNGTPFVLNCGLRNVNVGINNALDETDGYNCGLYQDPADEESGAIRGNCDVTEGRGVQFDFTAIDSDDYDAYDKMQKMESLSASLKYEGLKEIAGGYKHSAEFKLIHGNIADIDHDPQNGKNAHRITTSPMALGMQEALELVLINDVESYSTPSW